MNRSRFTTGGRVWASLQSEFTAPIRVVSRFYGPVPFAPPAGISHLQSSRKLIL